MSSENDSCRVNNKTTQPHLHILRITIIIAYVAQSQKEGKERNDCAKYTTESKSYSVSASFSTYTHKRMRAHALLFGLANKNRHRKG